MPQPQVPNQPPIIINQPDRPQSMSPTYNQNTDTDSRSNSDSSSDSRSSNAVTNVNSTTQINSTLNYFESRGLKLPTTSLTINGYANQSDQGVVIGVTIPLGNRGSRALKTHFEEDARTAQLNNATLLASACANMQSAGVVIDWSNPEVAAQFASLKSCQGVSIKSTQVAQTAPEDIASLKAELAAMRKEIQTYRARIQVTAPEVQTTIPALW